MHEGNVFLPKVHTMHFALTMQSECCMSTSMLGEIHQHVLEVCVSLHQREGLGPAAHSQAPELGEGSIPTDSKIATKNSPTMVLSKSLPRSSHTEQGNTKDFYSSITSRLGKALKYWAWRTKCFWYFHLTFKQNCVTIREFR